MTRDEVIRMAREAGFTEGDISLFPDLIVHFAALVAAAEREACAQMLDEASGTGRIISCTHAATAIRARGQA